MTKKLMLKQLASMLASFKRKKKYYCEVEYLENTETGSTRNWINTEIIADPLTTKWEVRVAFNDTGTGKLMGSGYAGSTRFNLGIESSKFRFGFATSWFDANQDIVTPDTNPHTWSLDATTKTGTIDGYSATSTAEFGVERYPIALFGRANGNTSVETSNTVLGKIYYTKIWQNNVLVRDMIPVLDWNYVPCMYDKVSGELFYNAGTGTFSYGREIHYVDYLESTEGASQWIDTGYIVNTATDEIELDFQFLSDTVYKWIFGDHYGTKRLAIGSGDGETKRNLAYNTTTYKIADKYLFNNPHHYNINSTGAYIDGDKLANYSSFTGSANLYLFTINIDSSSVYTSNGKIWKYSHKRNGEYIRDMYPAIDENGVGFMFDKVTHNIFNNAGTDAFKYPAKEVEYLQSDGVPYIDTEIQPTDDYGYKIRNTYTRGGGEQCAIGCMDNGNRFVGIYTSGAENQLSGAWGSFVNFLPAYTWATGDILDVEVNYKNSRKMIAGGTELKDISDVHISGTISNTLYLFARHYGSTITKMQGKIYGVEITNGQNVVADFIPAFKDGQTGMYDKVSGVLKTNTGTGTFITGKIKESEYLE